MFGRSNHAAMLLVLLAIFGLSFKGIFAKLAYIAGVNVPGLMLVRLPMALPIFWLVGWAIKRGELLDMTWRDWRDSMLVGVFFLATLWADSTAIKYLGAGLSRMVLFTFPLLIVVITSVWQRRPPAGHQVLAFVLAYGGLVVLLLPAAETAPPHFWAGVAWASAAAVTYALYLTIGTGVMNRIGSVRFTVAANTGAVITLAVLAVTTLRPEDVAMTVEGFWWVTAIVVFSTVVPMFMLYEGMRRLGPERASLISLCGPAVTAVLAWVLLGETLGPIQLGGFVLVIGGLWVLERPRRAPEAASPAAIETAIETVANPAGGTRG